MNKPKYLCPGDEIDRIDKGDDDKSSFIQNEASFKLKAKPFDYT